MICSNDDLFKLMICSRLICSRLICSMMIQQIIDDSTNDDLFKLMICSMICSRLIETGGFIPNRSARANESRGCGSIEVQFRSDLASSDLASHVFLHPGSQKRSCWGARSSRNVVHAIHAIHAILDELHGDCQC